MDRAPSTHPHLKIPADAESYAAARITQQWYRRILANWASDLLHAASQQETCNSYQYGEEDWKKAA